MPSGPIDALESKPFGVQILLLSAVLDPLGAGLGCVLAPRFDVSPLLGAAGGVVVAGVILSTWILRHAVGGGA